MPRAGLNRDRVLDEAERVADEVGLGNLTLAAVAERLQVRQPSLYKHIDGLDALHRGLAVRAKSELAQVVGRATVGRSGADAVRALAGAYRGWAAEHPGRYAATLRAPAPGDGDDEAASAAVVVLVGDILAAYGLSGDDAIDATRALRSALHGFVALEALGGFGLPVSVDRSFDRLVTALVAALERWSEPEARSS